MVESINLSIDYVPVKKYDDMKKLCMKRYERIKELEAKLEQHRWIPVSESLPKNVRTMWVLLNAEATGTLTPGMGFCGDGIWEILTRGLLTEVTHWKEIILPDKALKGG